MLMPAGAGRLGCWLSLPLPLGVSGCVGSGNWGRSARERGEVPRRRGSETGKGAAAEAGLNGMQVQFRQGICRMFRAWYRSGGDRDPRALSLALQRVGSDRIGSAHRSAVLLARRLLTTVDRGC